MLPARAKYHFLLSTREQGSSNINNKEKTIITIVGNWALARVNQKEDMISGLSFLSFFLYHLSDFIIERTLKRKWHTFNQPMIIYATISITAAATTSKAKKERRKFQNRI